MAQPTPGMDSTADTKHCPLQYVGQGAPLASMESLKQWMLVCILSSQLGALCAQLANDCVVLCIKPFTVICSRC